MDSYFGRDNSHLRYSDLTTSSVRLRVSEDTTVDTELIHAAEKVSYLALGGLSELTAVAPMVPPTVTNVLRDGGAVSPDTLDSLTVTFDQGVMVAPSHLALRNDSTGGTLVDLTGMTMSYDAVSRTAVWDLSGVSDVEAVSYTHLTLPTKA